MGLLCGWLLFAIFFTGTAAVFRDEGQFWLAPELHRPAPTVRMDLYQMVDAAERVLHAGASRKDFAWVISLPAPDDATFRVRRVAPSLPPADRVQIRYLDAATGEVLSESPRASRAMDMLYQFHYSLLMPGKTLGVSRLGVWIVGAMAVAMLVLLVSGVIVHKKIFTDFFTFRPDKAPARSWLDAHNVSAVMVLPFSLMITYTGLVIFWNIWMPAGIAMAYGDGGMRAMLKDRGAHVEMVRAPGEPVPLLPLRFFVEQARNQMAPEQTLRFVQVRQPGGTLTQVGLTYGDDARLWGGNGVLWFNGATGKLILHERDEGHAAHATHAVFESLHKLRFGGAAVRWLYFLMSSGCCVMIVSGLVLWTVKRRDKAMKQVKQGEFNHRQMWGWRIAEALNVGTVAGLLIGTAVMFASNRLIPAALQGRDAWEVRVFFSAWLLCCTWALVRVRRLAVTPAASIVRDITRAPALQGVTPRRLWAEQLWVAAVLYVLIPAVNAIATPRSALWVTMPDGQWIVAGFDLTMLGIGAVLAAAARKAGQPRMAKPSPRRSASRPVAGEQGV